MERVAKMPDMSEPGAVATRFFRGKISPPAMKRVAKTIRLRYSKELDLICLGRIAYCGAQTPLVLHVRAGQAARPGAVQSVLVVHAQQTAPRAVCGATNEAITGRATIDARPI